MTSKETPEGTAAWDARVKELRESITLEDNLCSVLMDVNVGGFGMYENIARNKAKALVRLMDNLGFFGPT